MSAYMDTPHYRVNKFVSTLRALGMTRSPICTFSGISLTVDDLEAVIVASATLFQDDARVERMQEGGPWTLVERETGSTDKLWKCDECGMNVWCGRVPGPWSHMETCRHAVAAEQVRVMREALENIAGTNGSECAAPRPVAGDALKRAGKITRERNLPEPASPSNGREQGSGKLHATPLNEDGGIEFWRKGDYFKWDDVAGKRVHATFEDHDGIYMGGKIDLFTPPAGTVPVVQQHTFEAWVDSGNAPHSLTTPSAVRHMFWAVALVAFNAGRDGAPKMEMQSYTIAAPVCYVCQRSIIFGGNQSVQGSSGSDGILKWWHYPTCPPASPSEGRQHG